MVARGRELVVCDATRDPFFANNPLVGFDEQALVRAYCGVPIKADDGLVIAVLCVIDAHPRNFTDEQVDALARLGMEARAMLVPYVGVPPERASHAGPSISELDWCRYDPLARWIARELSDNVALACQARRRARGGWPARVLRRLTCV